MPFKKLLLFSLTISLFITSCKKEDVAPAPTPPVVPVVPSPNFPERFEYGSKTDYAAAEATLATGKWNLDDAIIGTTANDHKFGNGALRIQNTGTVTMNFNLLNGASVISLYHAKYGTDPESTFEVWVSTSSGAAWARAGGVITANSTAPKLVQIGMNYYGAVRIQIRKLTGGQLNIDDINILTNKSNPTKDDNMALGNPSDAVNQVAFADNYLLQKDQYTYSYNNTRGTANWVSWHLSPAWKGSEPRCDCFELDNDLPVSFFRAVNSDYTATGFDRGHIVPSDDRDLNYTDNAATFMMGNIMPQAPQMNQITWARLEDYTRTFINTGYEVYVIAGGYGQGGVGNLGAATTIAGGQITVPARYWKVIVILSVGSNDVFRVSPATRVIAVDMPNTQTVTSQNWWNYRVSVDALEATLGYDLLSDVNPAVQQAIEAVVDNGPTQ